MAGMRQLLMAWALVGASAWPAAAQATFTLAGHDVQPGTRQHIDLAVPAGRDSGTSIPVTVFHGARPGPVLAITAGVHGYEFPPILAAQELIERIDPSALRGTVILVTIANVSAFEARTPYVNPVDQQNLNRVFPGSRQGTYSEQLAELISKEFIEKVNVLVDLHTGTDRPTVDYSYIFNDEGLSRATGSKLLYRPKPGAADRKSTRLNSSHT